MLGTLQLAALQTTSGATFAYAQDAAIPLVECALISEGGGRPSVLYAICMVLTNQEDTTLDVAGIPFLGPIGKTYS